MSMAHLDNGPAAMTKLSDQDGSSFNETKVPGLHNDYHYLAKADEQARITTMSQVRDPPFTKLANPGPLGLLAFAVSTFVLGLYQCGVGLPGGDPRASSGPTLIFGLAFFMGGMAQLVAGIMQFRVGNTFGTTVHVSFSAFWLGYATFFIPSLGIRAAYEGDQRAFNLATGIYLTSWTLLTVLFLLASLRTNLTVVLNLSTLSLADLLLAISNFVATDHPHAAVALSKAGGVSSLISALIAFYGGASGIMVPETTFIRFPLGEFSDPEKQTKMV